MPAKDLVFTVLGVDRASNTFDKVGQSMDRMSKVGAKSMTGLLAASLGASAGIGAAMGGVSVVFAGVAAAALSQNAEVAGSFRALGSTIKNDLLADAAPLEDEFVGAAEGINAAFQELRPQMRAAFTAAQPHIESLVEGVTEFAGEAMPGMVTAVQSAGPVFDGLEHMLAATGRGVGDFFTVISDGAPEAGSALASLGDLMEGVLPNAGQMLVNLTQLWADHGDQAVRVISDLISVVTDLSSGALPGVSDAFGVALDVLEGVLGIIRPMTDQIGPLIGMWLSLSLAMRTIGAARSVLSPVGAALDKINTSMSGAVGPAAKMKTAVGGALSLIGGSWGIAVAGATAVLALFGQESQQTAQDQRSLTDALQESGGEFDAHARKTIRESQQYQDLSRYIKDAGLSEREYLDAVAEGGPVLDRMMSQLESLASGLRVTADGGTEAREAQEAQANAAGVLHYRTEDLVAMISQAQEEFRREQEAIGGVTASMAGAAPGASQLTEAIKVLGTETATTADRADALNTAWMRLLGIPVSMEDATAGFEASLDNIRAHLDQVKQGTDNWKAALIGADGQIILSNEAGRQLQANLKDSGEDYRTLAQTAYDTTLQRTGSEKEATAAAVAAATDRRNQFIAEMRQMGFNATQAKLLADRYLGLPDDILTLIRADPSRAQDIVDDFVARNNGRNVHMTLTMDQIPSGRSPWARAGGGPIKAGEMYEVGEHGREMFISDSAGTIVPHGATERFLASVRRGNTSPMALGAGAVGGGAGELRVVLDVRGGDSELKRMFRKMVYVEGGGNVQRALGRS